MKIVEGEWTYHLLSWVALALTITALVYIAIRAIMEVIQ